MPDRSRTESDAIKNIARSLATVSVEKAKADQAGGDPKVDAQYDAVVAAAGLVARHLSR